jgi:hypothetical protein
MREDKAIGPDILIRLREAAAAIGIAPETRHLLLEAVETIETLRVLVGIRDEIELEDTEPEGHA